MQRRDLWEAQEAGDEGVQGQDEEMAQVAEGELEGLAQLAEGRALRAIEVVSPASSLTRPHQPLRLLIFVFQCKLFRK